LLEGQARIVKSAAGWLHIIAAIPISARNSGPGEPVFDALSLGLRQLADPSARRLVLRSVLVATGTFALLFVAVTVVLGRLDATGLVWVDTVLTIVGSAAALVLAWLLFPVVMAAALGWFAEDVAQAVERRYYPDLPPAVGMGVGESVWATTRFTAIALLLNLLALPLYLLLPGPNLVLYLALNGYLLGREYFELVAGRRLPWAKVAGLRRRARAQVWLAGAIIAFLLTVPVLNLVAPVVAIAFMVHLFEGLRRGAGVRSVGGRPAARGVAAARPIGDRSV
jgi:CysZ protein